MLINKVFRQKLLKRDLSITEERSLIKTRGLKTDGKQRSKIALGTRLFNIHRKPRRKFSQILLNRTRDRKKQKVGFVEGMEEGSETMDRISELPEHIIHHILSFLRCPKDVTRTSVLSKRWRSLWVSFFSFNFDQRSFHEKEGEQINTFKKFVDYALATRLEPMLSIQKFRLHLTPFNFDLAPDMNHWISAATNRNVKDLEIHLEVKRSKHYILPRAVFTSKTITSLKLHGCKFDNLGDIKLSNLTELSIKKAHVNVNIIQSFISSCHLIEDLRLIECSCLEYLHISTLPKLTRVEVHECDGLKSVEIQAPNLQTFWYHGKRSIVQCKLNLVDCENLKILTLKDTYMTDKLFQDHLSKFPVLEKLVLHECNVLERITITSRKLKGLSLIRCKNLVEANIDAPNLFSFEYTGDKVPFSSMTISGLHEAKLYFEFKSKNDSQLSLEMEKFLQKFDKLYGFKLAVCSNKAVTIYEELKEINLVSINAFKLEITKSSATLKDFVDSFLRASQPKSLSIVSSPSSKFLKFINDKLTNRGENPICCKYYSRKCWRHYLEDVKTEVFEAAENDQLSGSNRCLMSSPTLQTSFKLNWKSRRLGC